MSGKQSRSVGWVVFALVALVASLWVGWGDFNPWIPQDTVRAAIQASPRTVVQLLVQFVVPVLLVAFLVREAAARMRGNARA
jgi:hypothetical protein